jgi:hypothetical protein
MSEDTAAPAVTITPDLTPDRAARTSTRTAVLVAAFDSQLKWAATIQRALEAQDFDCQVIVPNDVRHAISDAQLADYGGSSDHQIEYMPWADIVQRSFDADVVVLAVLGPQVSAFVHDLHDAALASGRRPPITVSGWVGVIIERIVSGYLHRYATDVVAVNSLSDLRTFREVAGSLQLPTDNLLLSGLPLLKGERTAPHPDRPVRTVLFADQPTVPSSREDRLYVYKRLIDYARAHPERTVVLKPRHRIGEDTIHKMKFHPEVLLDGVDRPDNFTIDYTPISERLVELDLMLTVSSTAALEAVGAGVPTGFVTDLGVREQLGNHIFLDSGLLRTFEQLEQDDIGTPEPAWIDDFFFSDGKRTPAEQIADRVHELTEAPRETPAIWQTPYFLSQHRLHTYRAAERGMKPALSGWAHRLRPAARWVLPYGLQLQLRRSRSRLREARRAQPTS